MLKHIIVILFGVFITNTLVAQSYNIKDESQRVNNKKYVGVSSLVEGDFDKVEEYWLDYLKDQGKVRRKRNYNQITQLGVKDLAIDTITYVTRVTIESDDSLGLIWLAPLGDFSEADLKSLNSDIEKILKIATRGFYVSVVQKKIDQSEGAAIVVSKNHQKLIYQGENFVEDSVAAENLKLELENRLEETILKIKVLSQQIIDNKAATIQAYEDLEKIKKVIASHKESLKKIK
jgi:ribosome-binding factor A